MRCRQRIGWQRLARYQRAATRGRGARGVGGGKERVKRRAVRARRSARAFHGVDARGPPKLPTRAPRIAYP